MDKKEICRKIRAVIGKMPEVRAAYVYGSFVSRDDFRDIDIALLLDPESAGDTLKYAGKTGDMIDAELGFGFESDIRILNDEPLWFQYEVISTGVPVFIRNANDRFDFETEMLIEYQDMKYNYDLFDREYLAKV
jgi:uncharacterized protein